MDILMSILDFIPVGFFLASAILLQRDLYNKSSKGAFAVFSAGAIIIFSAGAAKALHKLLYFSGICDWQVLKTSFFYMQTLGFVLISIAMVAILFFKQETTKASCVAFPGILLLAESFVAPQPLKDTMIFVGLMCLGVVVFNACLMVVSIKIKKPIIVILLVISTIFTLGMGYLSTKDSMSDWIKEFVNIVGQGTLFASALLFHKNGLGELESFNTKKVNDK